ncbi:MAG TPA: flagellar basal body rod protein FlgB [Armatimonadota bacterium]|jgi:flagellar basal-body rod protein FlgB
MLTDITQDVLSSAMDAIALRGRAINNNIANVETPGYQRQDIAFEAALRTALDTGQYDPEQQPDLATVVPAVVNDASSPARENGNNVDADAEMAKLAENTLRYQAIIEAMTSKNALLKTAIYEGKK